MRKTKYYDKNKVHKDWLLIDAKDKVLGRLATRIAIILQGKNKPCYTPNTLVGDRVVVINAKYVRVSGNKMKEKIYDTYSGYPDGRKEMTLERLMAKNPCKVLYLAVKGMIPKTNLGRFMMRQLKIYPEGEHLHRAQNPQAREV